VLEHEPDYRMRGVLLQRFDRDGRLEITVEGFQMRHFPDTDTLEVDEVRVRAHGADGLLTTATARKALTDNATSELQLMGGAIVQREGRHDSPSLRFESEFLHANVDRRTVKSHLPVKLQVDDSEIRAKGFRYDGERGVVVLDGPLQTKLSPESGKVLSRIGDRPPSGARGTASQQGGSR
jgi:lipopolysaccharide export system protein LptC